MKNLMIGIDFSTIDLPEKKGNSYMMIDIEIQNPPDGGCFLGYQGLFSMVVAKKDQEMIFKKKEGSMATIEDYTTGRACQFIQSALCVLDTSETVSQDSKTGRRMLNSAALSNPIKMSLDQAIGLMEKAQAYAVGERVCRALDRSTPLTESVFLDELATEMVAARKAVFVSKQQAVENMKKYKKQPILVSKVSGRHLEICPTWPHRCLFWNMERHKLKCIQR